MLDFSFAESALIVIVAVIFIGPNELPVVIKALAKVVRGFKSITKEFRILFDEISKEAGLDDVAKEVRMIQGDDGKMYEVYDHPIMTKKADHD